MEKNIKLKLDNLQKEINRREAGLNKLYKAKKMLEIELAQQEVNILRKYMEQNHIEVAEVLKILKKQLQKR